MLATATGKPTPSFLDAIRTDFEESLETIKGLLNVSLPLISWQTANFGKYTIATALLGYLVGATGIAAYNLAGVTLYLLSLPTILCRAVESIINQSKDDPEKLTLNFQRGIMLSIATGVACMALLSLLPGPLLRLMGQNPTMTKMVEQYCRCMSLSVIPGNIVNTQIAVLNARNDRNILVPMSAVSLFVNSVSSYIFMSYFGLGLAGLALGYFAESSLTALVLGLYIRFSDTFKSNHFLSSLSWESLRFNRFVNYSLPFSYDNITRALMMFTRKSVLASLGPDALVLEQVAFQWLGLSDLITEGVNQAATVKIAQLSETNDCVHRKQVGNANLKMSFIICTAFIAALLFMPQAIMRFYLNANDANTLNDKFNLLYCFAFIAAYKMLLKLNYALTSNLLGILDTKVPNIINSVTSVATTAVLGLCIAGYISLNFYSLFAVFIVAGLASTSTIYERWAHSSEKQSTLDETKKPWLFFSRGCTGSRTDNLPSGLQPRV